MIHIAMTLGKTYLCGSIAGVFSVLQHSSCPKNIVFHFIASCLYSHNNNLHHIITSTFPYLSFHLYLFDSNLVKGKISYSIRCAFDQPLNYARIYLTDLVPSAVHRIIYFDSDFIVVDDVAKLWNINLGNNQREREREREIKNFGFVLIFWVCILWVLKILGAQSLARWMESRKNNVVSVAKFVVQKWVCSKY